MVLIGITTVWPDLELEIFSISTHQASPVRSRYLNRKEGDNKGGIELGMSKVATLVT